MNYKNKSIPTPSFIVNEKLIIKNLEILKYVQDKTNCHILLAQKAFSMYSIYPLIKKYIKGTTASGLYEAKLGFEEMGGEVHIFSPAYTDNDFDEITDICDHIVFNSFNQWNKFKDKAIAKNVECGIRINPEYAEIETDIYNPCFKNSRLGVTLNNFDENSIDGISGLHFHTMCEQNSDTLERTLKVVEEKFGKYLYKMKWVNFGGGHHITRPDYDIDKLINCINYIKNKYNVEVYLEPGEAVALNAGFLVSEVVDIIKNNMEICIMDTSAACHMPDVLEMPYRPMIIDSGKPNEKSYTYRLGGPTCLAGDIIGDYSFDKPLKIGDRLVFTDMAIYSMVKTNTFNGMKLPSIILEKIDGNYEIIKQFGYEDFKSRL